MVINPSCTRREKDKANPLFEVLEAKSLGIDFENRLTYTEEYNVYLYRSFYNGAGCGLADFNNDGFLDLFFSGNQVDNALYLGDGNFNFKDVTEKAGVGSPQSWSTGVSVVDINQDGWLDLYVCKSGDPDDRNRRNELFINQGISAEGIPIFKEASREYGLDNLGFSVHAVFLDYDRDGDLDMYLSNNSINPTEMVISMDKGIRNIRDEGGGNKLYRNDNNTFTDVSAETGIYSSAIGFGLGLAVGDVNRDSWPDIYVANDFFEKDYLYMNNGNGTFSESIDSVATELSLGSMGVDIADLDNNGYPEVYVTEMLPKEEGRLKTKTLFDNWDQYSLKVRNDYHRQFPRNTLQLNNGLSANNYGKVTFSEISRYAGVAATDWSWGVQIADFDLDGLKEIFVTNGIPKDLLDQDYIDFYSDPSRVRKILKEKGAVIKELVDHIPSQPVSNVMFKQQGDLKFENMAADWGMDQTGFSSGSAYGDIDNDGDLDLVVSNINGPPFIYKNRAADRKGNFLVLSLQNADSTDAIGAQVTLFDNGKKQYMELYRMRGVMSAVDNRLHFGLGSGIQPDSVQIVWPDGSIQVEKELCVNCFLNFKQSSANYMERTLEPEPESKLLPLKEVTDSVGLTFIHRENDFIDFDREKLLFHMISNEGPKVVVGDVNGDGQEDFYIGGAKEVPGSLFISAKEGFRAKVVPDFEADRVSEDADAAFLDADGDGDLDLLVGSGGYEFSNTSFALVDRLYINDGDGNFKRSSQILPNSKPGSSSAIATADYDADGDLDVFVGGRVVLSSYGVPASSSILENDGQGNFKDVTKWIAPALLEIGMVTDAVWTDYDNDGDNDLVVVGEWMPVTLLENDGGMFSLAEKPGLTQTAGLWNTLYAADLDGDGREDLVAGNIGENTFFKASAEKPLRMYVNDFDHNGQIEQVITRYNGDKAYPFALKKKLTGQLPYLLKKYLKHSDYKDATIDSIFSKEQLNSSLQYEVAENKSIILWNDGDHYTASPLPYETQLYPVYAILATDINGDGQKDLILGGNQYKAQPQTGIYGAGYGSVLLSEGNRKYRALDSSISGFSVEGEIRDIREITINNEKHLLVALNNDRLRIYEIRKIE